MRPVVALGRHGGTEVPGLGASPGAHLFFSSLERSLRRRYDVLPVPVYYYGMDGSGSVAIAADILSRADLCVFGLPPHAVDLDAFFLVRAHLGRRIPFLYLPLGEFPRGAWVYRHIHDRLGAEDILLFSSRADQAVYDALVAGAPSRTALLPFGIATTRFREGRGARAVTRRQLDLPTDTVVFVSHGRLSPEKNPHGAVMMFCRIARQYPAARLWIIGPVAEESGRGPGPRLVDRLGDGVMSRAFRRLLDDPGIARRVWFWGGVSQEALPRILGAADIAVNLTLNEDENFGYSTIEAMAAGLPVIGTDWGGLKDTLLDGETGFSIRTAVTAHGPVFDADQAASRAARLAGDDVLRRRMGAAARRRATHAYSQARFARALDAVIADALAGEAPGAGVAAAHRWTPLGDALLRCCRSDDRGYGSTSAAPIPPTATRFADFPILRDLLAGYATPAAPPGAAARHALATAMFARCGDDLRSEDPRWPVARRLDPLERGIVARLQAGGAAGLAPLAEAMTGVGDRRAVASALRRLIRAGVVVRWPE